MADPKLSRLALALLVRDYTRQLAERTSRAAESATLYAAVDAAQIIVEEEMAERG